MTSIYSQSVRDINCEFLSQYSHTGIVAKEARSSLLVKLILVVKFELVSKFRVFKRKDRLEILSFS